MSELIEHTNNGREFRWTLLATVSTLALVASGTTVIGQASADEGTDHPTVWIELGGQLERVDGTGDRFAPPFTKLTLSPGPYQDGSPIDFQKPARFSYGAEGNLTIQPEGSNWVFSGSVRYGRSNNKRDVHRQTQVSHQFPNPKYERQQQYPSYFPNGPTAPPTAAKYSQNFAETTYKHSESHFVLDFQAGKDVGLGMFGHGSTSVLSAGVRIAQMASHSDVKARAKPSVTFYNRSLLGFSIPFSKFTTYYVNGSADRNFRGIGPSLSWKASVPVLGNPDDGQFSVDWGLNGALLFGRQRTRINHHTTARQFRAKYKTRIPTSVYTNRGYRSTNYTTLYKHGMNHDRSRGVTIPNVGISGGISYRFARAKFSLGYRAEFFFGAVDAGIDQRRTEDLIFHGPYASISIGLGG